MGTPHCRWRDSVQSGRLAIMPCRRAWPQAGKNCVFSTPRSAVARNDSDGFTPFQPCTFSMPANHWMVARRITGVLCRQQCM